MSAFDDIPLYPEYAITKKIKLIKRNDIVIGYEVINA